MVNPNEKVLDKIWIDLYNKKVTTKGDDGSVISFKCSSLNEMVDLIAKCKKLLSTDNIIYR